MPKLLLSILLSTIGLHTLGQHQLAGQVIDTKTKLGVPYAQVLLPQLNQAVQADASGRYLLTTAREGRWRVEVSSLGYLSFVDTVLIQKNTSYNINLQPYSTELAAADVNARKDDTRTSISLKKIEGTAIYASKKTELIELKNITANLSNNNARQALARVPGVNVWESDAAGLQLGVGARGLSPDRTSNFNMRQNGYDIAADALGYPESYYAPPMQALERIEIVRGAASLQYGTQFGGMINLVLKEGDPQKKIHGKTVNTYNSLGHFNTFNEVGGQLKNTNYYSFFNYRGGNSFRPNTNFNTTTAHLGIRQSFSENFSLKAELTSMRYLAQQAGGLTDVQFAQDPDQSFRTRNWFAVQWNLFALTADYTLSSRSKLNSRTFGLLGSRNALGNLNSPVRQDSKPFSNRDLLVDNYRNIGNETRFLHRYRLRELPSAFLIGLRYYRGFTQKQQGFGTNGTDPDFTFVTENRKLLSDYSFPSENLALFAENVFTLSERLSITPGIRYEHIQTNAKGYYDSSVRVPLTGELVLDSSTFETRNRNRSLLLLGVGASYQLTEKLESYANFSQNYRAITFNNLRVVSPAFAVDENLQDEKGYNADAGIRGNLTPYLSIDAGVFFLSYQNRIGSILTRVQDNQGNFRLVRYTTNVADARIWGFETYTELVLNTLLGSQSPWKWSIFNNLALIDARYTKSDENGVDGNQVEAVPLINLKSGLNLTYKSFRASFQYTYLSTQFSDASNAESSGDGLVGRIPAYYVMDFSMQYSYRCFDLESGINNLTNHRYFTRRAIGYPGPGIIPSAPLHVYLGLGVRF
jgi:Fe(3+) dicitrate transport protein